MSQVIKFTRPVKLELFRELVKTNLHARDPPLRGGGKEETMGL